MEHIAADDVLVRSQDTPNPYALKFVVNQILKQEGKATFNHADECTHLVLAKSLFEILGVKQIYFFQNTLTVTYDGQLSTDEIKSQVTSVIKTRYSVHDPHFHISSEFDKNLQSKQDLSDLSPERQKIEEILDRTIRPGLQADGGGLEVLEFENNEVKILYQGACGGCPSAMMGTLDAIQGILRQEMENEELIIVPV